MLGGTGNKKLPETPPMAHNAGHENASTSDKKGVLGTVYDKNKTHQGRESTSIEEK
jgi:hypothetical protein